MGWGVCFALDNDLRVYCQDGCKWSSKKSDYADYYPWPSARKAVLAYFEGPAHRELDMIRDECPGTASALREACEDHMGSALSYYDRFSNEKKQTLHEKFMEQIQELIEQTDAQLAKDKADLESAKKNRKDYKPTTSKLLSVQMKNQIDELTLDYEVQKATENFTKTKKLLALYKKQFKLEKAYTNQ